MINHKTLNGILALVDIVNFTGQATKLGNQYTAQFTDYFQEKVTEISSRYGFQTIKSLGDAILLFGSDPEGLLNIMVDLFHKDKPEDKYGFICCFRMVAHSGFFQFKIKNDQPIDLVSPQGIMVFRMEKHAQQWELAVTPVLYEGIKEYLTLKNLEVHRVELQERLKGFNSKEWGTVIYRLRLVNEDETAVNLLEVRLNQLEKDVQYIPVFGNIYPQVPMEKNFINLSLAGNADDFLKGFDEEDKIKFKASRDLIKGEWPLHEWDIEKELNRPLKRDVIDVNFLYDKFPRGVIMGLPGAGKTTILRNIAYREFKNNERKEEEKKQLVLFVRCGNAPFYDAWHREYEGGELTGNISWENALNFMTWLFLFDKKGLESTPWSLVEFRESAKRVGRAFTENRVTLLMDALDEAADIPTRERIAEMFLTLYLHESKNRLYLTSRPSEKIHLLSIIKQSRIPLFNVLSLTMEQVRAIARNLMEENSNIYNKFDKAIWQEEVVVKMAATPLIALLITAYFHAYEKFDTRYPMYDLLVKFILLKAWDNIKTGVFGYKNMELFFQEIKSPGFLDKNKEVGSLYSALASLCFDLFYSDVDGIIQRSVTEEQMDEYFTQFIQKRYSNYSGKTAQAEAVQWRERFYRDNLVLQAGRGNFVFVHSTVMEFLAAYHMVEESKQDAHALTECMRLCTEKETFLELETVPIAAGSSLTNGYDILRYISNCVNETSYKNHVYRLGVKCLSEVEWTIQKILRILRIKSLRRTIEDMIDRNLDAVQWVYLYIRDILLSSEKDQLKEMVHLFDSILKLSLPAFLEYIEYKEFDSGDSELVELRKKLLFKLAQKEIVEQFLNENKKETLISTSVPASVLQLDSKVYHPEDKNFDYYQKLIGKELTGFYGSPNLKHSGAVMACAFSPDEKTVLSASSDKTLKLWDAATGREIRTFYGHIDFVTSCAFSPDGKTLLSTSKDKTLKLWDVATGREIRTLNGHTRSVYGCGFSPDGKTVLSASDDLTLKLWDVATGWEIRTFAGHTAFVTSCAFSPDGKTVLSASFDKTLKLWDAVTGREIHTFSGHTDHVLSCAFSPDGRTLLSASQDRTLRLWDAVARQEIQIFSYHESSINKCTFSPDGKIALSASSDGTLKLWDAKTGWEIRTFSGHMDEVLGCTFSPDGNTLLSASNDATLKLWDSVTGKVIRTFNGHDSYVFSCVFSPDGNTLLSASKDATLKLWDSVTGKVIRTFKGHYYSVNSGAFSSDGVTVLSASDEGTLRLWDAETGLIIRSFYLHTSPVLSCAFSPDGKTVLSASCDKTMKLWNAATGREIQTFSGHTGSIWNCAFSFDGKTLLSASEDHTLKLWDADNGREIRSFEGHTDSVYGCAFSPDGPTILSASRDRTLKLWNAVTGREIRTLDGHTHYVWGCAFAPNGRIIVSVSWDKTIRLWNIETGRCIKTLELPWIPQKISICPVFPKKVLTANANGTVTVFEFDELA
ncbi:MAG: hypothetical protein ACM3SY_10740 [Candidatus Omnitrophota bacterium]